MSGGNDGPNERAPCSGVQRLSPRSQSRSSSKRSARSMHMVQIAAITPAPVRISCEVCFWHVLQNRRVLGKGSTAGEFPGNVVMKTSTA